MQEQKPAPVDQEPLCAFDRGAPRDRYLLNPEHPGKYDHLQPQKA